MKPSAMLYRNLLAIEIEEMVRANPLDGLVVLANCDKSVPGALMGAISANVPVVLVTGGARPVAQFRGQPAGTGTALWRMWDERRAGRLDDAAWDEFERCLSCGRGACNTMGTASTMAILCEVLGLMVAGSAAIPAGEKRGLVAARQAGRLAVSAVLADLRPQSVLSPDSFVNAIVALNAVAGSTNAVIHLAAMAGRAGLAFPLEDIAPDWRCRPRAGRCPAVRRRPDAGLRRGGRRSGPAPRAGRVPASRRAHGRRRHDRGRRRDRRTGHRRYQAGHRPAPRRRGVRRGQGNAGAGRRGDQDVRGNAAAAAAPRARGCLPRLRGHAGQDRRPGARHHAADGTGADRVRPGRCPRHARMGHDPDPGAAGPGRGH